MIYSNDFVNWESEVLNSPVENFNFNSDVDPIELTNHLAEVLLTQSGLGLAANQLGIEHRVFVIKANPIIACFNPRIVAKSTEEEILDEYCFSYPGLKVKVKRPTSCRVRYVQPNGETVTKDFEGITARIFQHELDHLNGITMYDRASWAEKERAKRKMKKLKRS